MYAQKSGWSILKKWCSEKFREVGGLPRLQECFLPKAVSGTEFGRLQHWRARAPAPHVHFSGTNYSHVKHRKCREQSLTVGQIPRVWDHAGPVIVVVFDRRRKIPLPPVFRVRVRNDNSA